MPSVTPELLIALAISLLLGLLASAIAWLIFSGAQDIQDDSEFIRQIQEITDDYDMSPTGNVAADHGRNIAEKWKLHWQKIGVASGLSRYESKENTAPRDVLFLGAGIFLAVSIVARNPIPGIMAAPAALYALNFFYKMKYNKMTAKLNGMLPGFLFALKANLQAGETPVRGILKIVDNTPSPLYEDLLVVKHKILANSTFAEALEALIAKTASPELKFLASCLIQASNTGANIEPQIDSIQKILEQRQAAADELARAVKAAMPAIYIGSFALPVSLLATYILDPTAREFWFVNPISYIVLGGVCALYLGGMWMTRKMVESIRNL